MNRLVKRLLHLDDFISAMALVIIILITMINVFMRYVLDQPLEWAEEVILALIVWCIFIGISTTTKYNDYVSIDFLVARMPEKAQRAFGIFREVLVFAVTAFVFVYLGFKLAFSSEAWAKLTPIFYIHYTFIDLAVPVGGTLALIHMLRKFKSK